MECIINSINASPQKGSINKILGANKILLGKSIPNFDKKIIFFGYYAMVYTGTKTNLKRISITSIS